MYRAESHMLFYIDKTKHEYNEGQPVSYNQYRLLSQRVPGNYLHFVSDEEATGFEAGFLILETIPCKSRFDERVFKAYHVYDANAIQFASKHGLGPCKHMINTSTVLIAYSNAVYESVQGELHHKSPKAPLILDRDVNVMPEGISINEPSVERLINTGFQLASLGNNVRRMEIV